MNHIAIIGSGPVGLFSVFACGMLGYKCHVFDSQPIPGGQCLLYPEKPIYDIPGFLNIDARDLIDRLIDQGKPFKPVWHLNTKVADIKKTECGFDVIDDSGNVTKVSAVIIAAGIGAFEVKKPEIDNIDCFSEVMFDVQDKACFEGKRIAIAGGGDSAVDWAIELANTAAHITLVHRREQFRCQPVSETKIRELVASNVITLKAPYQLSCVMGGQSLEKVVVKNIVDESFDEIYCDYLLSFFGFHANLGPLVNWGLGIENGRISVDYSSMQTNQPGIYAIGDIASYSGKLKLIATGFSEAFVAAHSIRSYLNPSKSFSHKHSTSTGIKELA